MKTYVITETETMCERKVLARSFLEAIWITFGPGHIKGIINETNAASRVGNTSWDIRREE